MIFSEYFSKLVDYKQLTRKDVLRLFHLSGYDDISHVDSITLSRWLNGKTTPNLYKQLIIVSCLSGSVLDFIINLNIDELKGNQHDENFYSSYIRKVDYAHNSINYIERSQERRTKVESLSSKEILKKFEFFHRNFSCYRSISDNLELSLAEEGTLISCFESDQIVGHIAYFECSKLKTRNVELSNVLFFTPIYYADSVVLREIMVEFFTRNLNQVVDSFCYAVGFTRSGKKLDFHHYFGGAEILEFFPPDEKDKISNTDKGLFLVKVDLLKYLSKKVILKEVLEHINKKKE
ncbi:hypothetical protein [Vibrio parahaemolyticus]|uniref:XRE framily transcriptional regulator n=3 Tax=Vibrio parahaemolyticus TaxID=670 RepID=A0A024B2P8_VIBPH|nr:hypothetical protein [Vibrio parahaemolyticus]AHZ10914.1 XRE framily transcriptional regulator [Vibrio parahaemolyticus]AWG86222.1 XRE framily transcriptional regulator [Vibrio parahaemolyticus]KFE93428.1 hypothetical protein HB39_21925 [Vibrio parahaemolyticus]MBE4098970.1 hypothetical protein [Vibrio parahaemolyticus]MBE4134199.1 hypothetical protein [Vibrio parahaemolyticus]